MTDTIVDIKKADSVELDKSVDFLIFSNVAINVEWEETNSVSKGMLIDRHNNTVLVKSDCHAARKKGDKATLICPYRGKRLVFDVFVQSTEEEGLYICEKPKYGYLINERTDIRSKFDKINSDLSATLDAETIIGDATFHTQQLVDFSAQTLSLILDRADGILLPNDYIKQLIIHSDNGVVIEASGVVLRTEHHDNQILVVVELLDLNERPALDIHKNERRSERVEMYHRNDAFIEFDHPFVKTKVSAYVSDLSNSGLSIMLEPGNHVLVQGLVINKATLQLPLRPRVSVSLKIKRITQTVKDQKLKTRVSIEFLDITPALDKELTACVQHSVSDNLSYARGEDYNDIWEFYFDTGFIYENKRRQIQGYSEKIRETNKKLIFSETPLLKKVVYRTDGKIIANGTAIKAFDNTLLLQHLQSLKSHSGEAAKNIIRGMTTFFLDLQANRQVGNHFVCTYYRPNNMFPSLVFGDTADLIGDEEKCWKEEYLFCLQTHPNLEFNEIPGITCREANATDKARFEELIIRSGDIRLLRLESLTREKITNLDITKQYNELGLYRYRKLFVAENLQDGSLCYAICSYASPGMNLSELTNSVKFIFNTENHNKQKLLINQITKLISESYEKTEMSDPVFLVKPNQAIPEGFKNEKSYILWALDLSYIKLFKDNSESIFQNLREHIKKKRAV